MAKSINTGNSAGKLTLLILTCFFLSGLTSLIYEMLWIRMIVKIIGGAPFAVSIILTIFMAGLGLGSYIASRTIDRVTEPKKLVKIYGMLELAIGAYALIIPVLLKALLPFQAILYNQLYGHFLLYNFLTFLACSVLLCIPTICMGATLPILCRFYVTRLSHLGTHAGRLYGLNTIGAAVGSLLCGFWLISLLGVTGTLIFAVIINAAIGLVCILASHKKLTSQNDAKQTPQTETPKAESSKYPKTLHAALIIFAMSGFCAMAYEVIWTKLLGLIVGPTTYSFTIVLVTFILGLALGSMFFGWLGDKIKNTLSLLLSTQIIAALLVLLISQLLGNSQLFFAKLIFTFKDNFALLNISKAVILFAFMITPTLCLGATFPLVGKIYTQSISRVGKSIGFAYSINTIGAVLGAFCAGFIIIPTLGKENGLSLVVSLQLLTALIIAVFVLNKNKGTLKLAYFLIPTLTGILLCLYLPTWNRHLLSEGKYLRFHKIRSGIENTTWLNAFLKGPGILAKLERGELVYYGDGIGGFTTVTRYPNALGGYYFSMANSGKPEASSHSDMKTQTLLAHFPMLFHQNPKNIMVLGLASGVTAGEVLHYPIEKLDVLDISQQVVQASDFFLPWNNNVLSNPKTNLIIQDGRAHLQLTKQKYDVIISEPSNPWMAGLATLFTQDFFELAKNSLNQDGIFVQWLHSYQMDWDTFALIGRTFAQVFPNSLLTSTEISKLGHDYLLVGFKGSKGLVLDNAKQNLRYAKQSKNMALSTPELLYLFIKSEDLELLFGHGPFNTDGNPRLEFTAPKLMYKHDPIIFENIQKRKGLSTKTKNIIKEVTTNIDSQIDFAEYAFSVNKPFPNMVDLSKATLLQKERFFELVENYCARAAIDFTIFSDDKLKQRLYSIQIETLERNIDLVPDKALSYFCLAGLYYVNNMPDKAIVNYSKSLQINPDNTDARVNLAAALYVQGRLDEAIDHYTKSLKTYSEHDLKVHKNLAAIFAKQNKPYKAIRHFQKALEIQPDDPIIHNNLGAALALSGRLDEAIEHFAKAVQIKPDFEKARYNLRYILGQRGKSDKNPSHPSQ